MAKKPAAPPKQETRDPITMELTKVMHCKDSDASGSFPLIKFVGEKPLPGDTLVFVLANSIPYRGTVKTVVTEGEEHTVRFEGGLEPRSSFPIRRKGIRIISTSTMQMT